MLSVQPLWAAEENPSSIWLRYSEDEDHIKETYIDVNVGMDTDNTLLLRAGQSDTPFNTQTVTTYEYFIGLNSFHYLPWSLDIGYEYWGKDREMVIHTLQLGANWNSDDWALGINLEYREIDFYTRVLMSGQYKIETESIGVGPVLQFYKDKLSLGFSGMWYDYSDDPERLNSAYALILLGGKNWSHAGTLNDWYAGGQLQYKFVAWQLGLHYLHSVAAIDQSESDDYSISLTFSLTKNFQLEIEYGQVFQAQDVTTEYAGVGVGLNF